LSDIVRAIILGIVEGITEFLPVSSTGHLLLSKRLNLQIRDDAFFSTFVVFIQIGAILAVVVYFRRRIIDLVTGRAARDADGEPSRAASARGMTPLEISQRARLSVRAVGGGSAGTGGTAAGAGAAATVVAGPGLEPMPAADFAAADAALTPAQRTRTLAMIAVATIPVLVVGYLAKDWVERTLEGSTTAVAWALLVGGLLMLLVEWLPLPTTTRAIEEITLPQAVGIGVAQVFAAVFPGTSRSAATIMGGMAAGLSRSAAAEFSFFLAIPAMFAACGYKLLKWIRSQHPSTDDLLLMGVGTVVSFLVAWVVIAGFMNYVRRRSFVPFAAWRIVLALLVFWLWRK
jgi:undecaprenyl-diphosphatase UppP